MPKLVFVDVAQDDPVREELNDAQIQATFRRALDELSIPYVIEGSGETLIADHIDLAYFDSETFRHTYEQLLHRAAVESALNALTAEGKVERVWVDETQQVGYRLVDDVQ